MSDAEDERPNKRMKRDPDEDDDDGSDDDDGEEVVGKDGKTSKGGSSCHQCKSRRNFGALTYCTSNLDKKNKRCRKKFCGHCLKKFYKESVQAIADKGNWKCPSCRKICCCAACRRRKTKDIGAGKDDASPMQTSKPKSSSSSSHKKSSSHRHYDRDHEGGSSRRSSGYHHGSDVLYHAPNSSREDEGYAPSSHHRRGDRSLLHQSSHSPRMSGHHSHMSDSPVRGSLQGNYDLLDGQSGGRQHGGRHHDDEYSSDNHYSDDSDSDSDHASDDGGAGELNAHNNGAQHYMHDDDQSSLPSSQFTALLSSHIKSLAEESARTPNSPFARLYKQAQAVRVKKKIKAILLRPYIKKEKNVELIAALLAPLEDAGAHDMGSSSAAAAAAQQPQQQQQPIPMATN